MKTSDFDYQLPERNIAQAPCPVRDECKMLVLNKNNGNIEDKIFKDILDYLEPHDLLIANETRVLPARLLGQKRGTNGMAEIFLLRQKIEEAPTTSTCASWEVLVRPGKRLKPGAVVDFFAAPDNICTSQEALMSAEILDWSDSGERGGRVARISTTLPSLDEALHLIGNTPLPPYIKDYQGDKELYQTVYSKEEKSAAAPTAGLHFTPQLISALKAKGVSWACVDLQVGLDTFRIVEEDDPSKHRIHTERYSVSEEVVSQVEACKQRGGRVIAVGTTSVRSLESAWDEDSQSLRARNLESTQLFILPGYTFKVVDALITNFHVPKSTLMMLVSAFASREMIMDAYSHAISHDYRMLSFGDAMFIH